MTSSSADSSSLAASCDFFSAKQDLDGTFSDILGAPRLHFVRPTEHSTAKLLLDLLAHWPGLWPCNSRSTVACPLPDLRGGRRVAWLSFSLLQVPATQYARVNWPSLQGWIRNPVRRPPTKTRVLPTNWATIGVGALGLAPLP